MSRSECKRRLVTAYPDKSICIEISDWHNVLDDGSLEDRVNYSVAILPGLGGLKCDIFYGKTLEEATEKALSVSVDREFERLGV